MAKRQRCSKQLAAVRRAAKGKRSRKRLKRMGKALAKYSQCKRARHHRKRRH